MAARQRIVPVRREYNRWAADQTLEDYALRFTAKAARRWSPLRVANTALGSLSFLALEAIGGGLTLTYGFTSTVLAILFVALLIPAVTMPVCIAAVRAGVDVDLLTRGAGFGYLGSTITSLIYASFTFIFFGIETIIAATMLQEFFGVPLWLGELLCAVAVLPLVTHGIGVISRFQLWTQPIWLSLNVAALLAVLARHSDWLAGWTTYTGLAGSSGGFDPIAFGTCASVLFALISQTVEQVDYLRFLPYHDGRQGAAWWAALLTAGPGWIVFDAIKLLAGSLLAYGAVRLGVHPDEATHPARMYLIAFSGIASPGLALGLTATFVILSQAKINVTNAYAGSIAWSNFFARLTHSHPGRVVWLLFNVAIALLFMELGAYAAIERTLVLYSGLANAWLGALAADLVVNKRLGLSPPGIEFRRAYLYDINPVGVGAMLLASLASICTAAGVFGATASAFSTFVAFGTAFATAPLIAWATGGRYYLARRPRAAWKRHTSLRCTVCEHEFEPEDTAYCPVYVGAICSLCCSLDARCGEGCKPHARADRQTLSVVRAVVPAAALRWAAAPLGRWCLVFGAFAITATLLLLTLRAGAAGSGVPTFIQAFGAVAVVGGVAAWLLVLEQESRRVAQEETRRQTELLMDEMRARRRTDAALQRALDAANAASRAKSQFVTGVNHELRSPLNAILGYAQLLERDPSDLGRLREGLRVIRRSGEHLTALVEGLLDISRIEAKRIDLRRDEVNLPEFLRQLVDMFELQSANKGLAFAFDRPADLPAVVCADEHRLRQVLINLLGNAVKFTDAGTITLRVRWRAEIAQIEVIDTGIGIAAADLDRIFEPLHRVETTGSTQPGLGLGLAITKVLVDVMGGEVSVDSTPGQGSRFQVRLLLSAATGPLRARRDLDTIGAERVRGYHGERRTLMVIDDDPAHRAVMRGFLAPLGFTVAEASSGDEYLRLIAPQPPALFLVDLSMPGLSGWSLVARLRALHGDVPIIVLSAGGQEPGVLPAAAAGRADARLSKPVSFPVLLDRIGELLGLRWISDEPVPEREDQGTMALTPDQIGRLRELAAIGHVSGLRAMLDALEHEMPAARDRLAGLRRLLAEYRLDAVLAALDGATERKGQ